MFTPAQPPQPLDDNHVHIWYFTTDTEFTTANLSPDELARAERLRIPHKRQQFIASRHITRVILSSYVRTTPEHLHFIYNEHGKPHLNELHFNLSHTEHHAVLAISKNTPVGIDIETIRAIENLDFILQTAFTEHEKNALRKLPTEEQQIAFWRCWTRKEALMKGIGIGFRIAKELTVSITEQPEVIEIQRPQAGKWHLNELQTDNNLLISIASQKHPYAIQTFFYAD